MSIDVKYQVPTVALHTRMFEAVSKSVARMNGTPRMRQVYVPHPVMGKTPEEMRAYIEGNDPTTGRPVMQEVIEGLTGSLTGDELEGSSFERSTPRECEPDTLENLECLFQENHWTDMLPIVLPTKERVAAMLKHTSHRPDEIVGHMRPTNFREYWEYTVEKVGVNAVMAGARPEYFPVILALASTGTSARGSSTSSMASMAVVNGPVRTEIGMNSGVGAMAPYNHANATIGRAFGLLSQNLQGGSLPGHTYMGSQGNNYAYNSVTFAENEERSPWEPFHVQHGFKAGDSTVSVFTGCQSTSFTLGIRHKHWREHIRNLLRGMDPNTSPVFVLDPLTAHEMIDIAGLKTKQDLIDWAFENARMPSSEYWDYQLIQNYKYPRATFGENPWATWLTAAPDELIPIFRHEDIDVVVVGGETNAYWRIVGCNYAKTVSVDGWR
ncbi:MAG: UGSC family (seleno)protein [Chloroflexota bacterium]